MIRYLFLLTLSFSFYGFKNIKVEQDTILLDTQTISSESAVINIAPESVKEPWYKEYEVFLGAFLSGIFGASIAVFSVYRTNKNNLIAEKDRLDKIITNNRSRYCGNLYSIYSELVTHTQLQRQKLTEINLLIEKLFEIKDVAADEPFTPFPVDFLKESRRLMLDFGDYRSSVFALLSSYINKTVDINNFLNLTKVRKSKSFFASEEEYVAGVKTYFEEILKHLEGFKFGRQELLEDIWYDMNRFEQFSNFRENTEQMKDLISTYEITDQSIENLRERGISEQDLERLDSIKNKHYTDYTDFTKELIGVFGNEYFEANQNIFIRNFRSKSFNEI